jgi:hypothetical protein
MAAGSMLRRKRPNQDTPHLKSSAMNKLARRPKPGNPEWEPVPKPLTMANGQQRIQHPDEAWADARALVRHYVCIGYSREQICRIMIPPISDQLLYKYFSHEVENGAEIQNSRIAGVAYQMAASGSDGGMTRFWLRTRGKWRDFDGTGGSSSIAVRMIPGDSDI